MPMDGLRSRLRKLGVVQGLAGLGAARAPQTPALLAVMAYRTSRLGYTSPRRQVLPGLAHATPYGHFWLSRQVYPPSFIRGRQLFGDLAGLDTQMLWRSWVCPILGHGPAFIDTETADALPRRRDAGVSGGGGDGKAKLVLHLISASAQPAEACGSQLLTDVLRGATGLVSFNDSGL